MCPPRARRASVLKGLHCSVNRVLRAMWVEGTLLYEVLLFYDLFLRSAIQGRPWWWFRVFCLYGPFRFDGRNISPTSLRLRSCCCQFFYFSMSFQNHFSISFLSPQALNASLTVMKDYSNVTEAITHQIEMMIDSSKCAALFHIIRSDQFI